MNLPLLLFIRSFLLRSATFCSCKRELNMIAKNICQQTRQTLISGVQATDSLAP